MRTDARVMISGAGVAGLTAAIWLGRHGFRPLVIERARSIRADGFIISISHQSYRFARELGLLPALSAIDARIAGSSYHDHAGRTLLTLDYDRLFGGVEMIQVMRDDLERVLYDEAAKVADFRFGTSASAIRQDGDAVEVDFTTGESQQFDVVLGADGLHSAVRQLAFPAASVKQHYLGLSCAAFRIETDIGLRAKFETHMERDRYLAIYTAGTGASAAVLVWKSGPIGQPPQQQRLAILQRAFRGAPPMVQRALAACPTDASIYMDYLEQIEMPSWHRGRVALVGDAAHCMTLLSGQGASAAFTGACHLARGLVEREPAEAFAQYEREMRPMIDAVQPLARKSAGWYVPRSWLRQFLRNSAMRLLPRAFFYRHFQSKYSKA